MHTIAFAITKNLNVGMSLYLASYDTSFNLTLSWLVIITIVAENVVKMAITLSENVQILSIVTIEILVARCNKTGGGI